MQLGGRTGVVAVGDVRTFKFSPLLLSLVLHLFLASIAGVFILREKKTLQETSENSILEIRVTQQTHQKFGQQAERPRKTQPRKKKEEPAPLFPSEPKAATSAAAPAATELETTAPSSPATQNSSSATQRYLSEVRAQIEDHLEFPQELQKKRISGQLTLRVTLTPEGQVELAEILKTSGSHELDELGKATVQLAAPFPAFRERLQRDDPLHFQVPLVFESLP